MEKELKKQFNLPEEDYNEWKNSSQKDSLPVWAIKNKKLHPDKYVDWAIKQHQLPFLKNSFFQEITITQQFWSRNKDREDWDETFVPLYEWDDTLFAGCIKPPEKTKDSNTVPILALPDNLKIFWKKIQEFPKSEKLPHTSGNATATEHASQKSTGWVLKSTFLLNSLLNKTILTQLKGTNENKTYEQILAISEKYFTGAIIFSYQSNEFKPVEWSESVAGPATPIKTDEPSIFKMIIKSRSTYHGFIVKNKQHELFFTSRGFETLPKHVTLIPVFDYSKNIAGAFMGISNNVLHPKHLQEITEWTKPLKKILIEVKSSHKAAA